MQYEAVNSCLMLLPQIANCEVLTVEGLAAPDGTLHPVQQALLDADATQCGFCTPGFVMAMFAFHHGGESADGSLIHEAMAGNLCRCRARSASCLLRLRNIQMRCCSPAAPISGCVRARGARRSLRWSR